MDLGVILPCTLLYGGVKRFLELGNIFIEYGHHFTVYTPEGLSPEWFPFKGKIKKTDALKTDHLDVLFTTEIRFLNELLGSTATRKIFYHVSNDKQIKKIARIKEIEVLACSSNIYEFDKKFGLNDFKAIGGVNINSYIPKTNYAIAENQPVNILAYGRLAMKCKGTKHIVKACEALYKQGYNIKLLLFDTPVTQKGKDRLAKFKCNAPYEFILNHPIDKNSELFNRADIFVAAEGQAGWSNTVAEAMACGVPVVATTAGTKDILSDKQTGLLCWRNSFSIRWKIKKLIKNENLRETLGKNGRQRIENFDWHILTRNIEQYLSQPAPIR